MSNTFFERPIINSPYDQPGQHWILDESGAELVSAQITGPGE